MIYIKTYENFRHIKDFREKREPKIGDYVRLTDEFYDEAIKNVGYVSAYNMTNKVYRIAVGEIVNYNEETKLYSVYFDEYEFWQIEYDDISIDDIKSFSSNKEDLENLPGVGDYVLLSGDDIFQVVSRERSNLRWSNFEYRVKKLNPGPHDGKGPVYTNDDSIKHFSKHKEDLVAIVSAKKYNL